MILQDLTQDLTPLVLHDLRRLSSVVNWMLNQKQEASP